MKEPFGLRDAIPVDQHSDDRDTYAIHQDGDWNGGKE